MRSVFVSFAEQDLRDWWSLDSALSMWLQPDDTDPCLGHQFVLLRCSKSQAPSVLLFSGSCKVVLILSEKDFLGLHYEFSIVLGFRDYITIKIVYACT